MEDNKPKAVDTKPQVDGATGDDDDGAEDGDEIDVFQEQQGGAEGAFSI